MEYLTELKNRLEEIKKIKVLNKSNKELFEKNTTKKLLLEEKIEKLELQIIDLGADLNNIIKSFIKKYCLISSNIIWTFGFLYLIASSPYIFVGKEIVSIIIYLLATFSTTQILSLVSYDLFFNKIDQYFLENNDVYRNKHTKLFDLINEKNEKNNELKVVTRNSSYYFMLYKNGYEKANELTENLFDFQIKYVEKNLNNKKIDESKDKTKIKKF